MSHRTPLDCFQNSFRDEYLTVLKDRDRLYKEYDQYRLRKEKELKNFIDKIDKLEAKVQKLEAFLTSEGHDPTRVKTGISESDRPSR